MADVRIKVTCGCGHLSSTLEEAQRHVDNTKHTVHVSLRIEPVLPRQ